MYCSLNLDLHVLGFKFLGLTILKFQNQDTVTMLSVENIKPGN